MRHQKKGFKLGRTSSHRKATLSALSNALIRHKRITTTITKAKALRMFVEPIINRAKEDSTLNRRQAFRFLQDKESIKELFGDIAGKIADRPGGYTRIVKLGQRAGDSTEMAIIELVDYNDVRPDGSSSGSAKKTRRAGRRKKSSTPAAATTTAAPAAAAATAAAPPEVVEEVAAEVAEEVAEVVVDADESVAEAPVAEVSEEPAAKVADEPVAEASEEEASADESDDKKEA